MTIKNKLLKWIHENDSHSLSVKMIARTFAGKEFVDAQQTHLDQISHPTSAEDIYKCVSLIDSIEVQDQIHELSGISCQWGFLVSKWPEIYGHYLDDDFVELEAMIKKMKKHAVPSKVLSHVEPSL